MQHLSFCVQLILLDMMSSSCIHFAASDRISFFLTAEQRFIAYIMCICVCTHITHTRTNATFPLTILLMMGTLVDYIFKHGDTMCSRLSDMYSEVGLLDHVETPFLMCKRPPCCFLWWPYCITFPTQPRPTTHYAVHFCWQVLLPVQPDLPMNYY